MRKSSSVPFFDFTGGLNTKSPSTAVAVNEASDLDNIALLPSGGFRSRYGSALINTAMMGSGSSVHGLGYFRIVGGSDFLVTVAGTKIYKSTAFVPTQTDITDTLTVTDGKDNLWTLTAKNDLFIGVGGAPDVPFKWSGSGNAAVLAGSPPSGSFGLTANNYFFIGSTSSNPSRIYWSILGDPEDWSGTGSGSQDVSKNDGDTLVGAAPLANNRLMCFKQNTIHELQITAPPFPLFQKFKGAGAVSKMAIVNTGDMIYFVTPQPRLMATDGYRIYDSSNPGPTGITDKIDPTWDALNKSRLNVIQAMYYPRLNQIWILCSYGTSTTNNYCIIWDMNRKAWYRNTTGFSMNALTLAQDQYPVSGDYAGFIYQLDKTGKYSDAVGTGNTSTSITDYWTSGWIGHEKLLNLKVIPYLEMNFVAQDSGTIDFSYGYDFNPSLKGSSVSMTATGAKFDVDTFDDGMFYAGGEKTPRVWLKGFGKFVQFKFSHTSTAEPIQFNGFEAPMKVGSVNLQK